VLLAVGAGVDAAAAALLPPGVTVVARRASQLVAEPVRLAGRLRRAGAGLLRPRGRSPGDQARGRRSRPGHSRCVRRTPNWSLFVRHGEAGKCAAMLLYEALRKPVGGALASVATGGAAWCWSASIPRCARRRWRRCGRACWATAGSSCGRWRRPGWSAPRRRRRAPATWRFTTSAPGAEWRESISTTARGRAVRPVSARPVPGVTPATPWTGADIWLRRGFESPRRSTRRPWRLWDGRARCGSTAPRSWTCGLHHLVPRPAARRPRARRPAPGRNVIAVHCRNLAGGQFIDLGLVTGAAGGRPAHAHDLLLDGPLESDGDLMGTTRLSSWRLVTCGSPAPPLATAENPK